MPDKKTFIGLRDYALMLLTLDTGLRPNEALSLTTEDIDLDACCVTVRREVSKTRRMRILPISQTTVKTIKKLINVRHEAWPKDGEVFCSWNGMKFRPNSWCHRLRDYGEHLSVKITAYDLRYTFSIMYLRAGGNPFSLQHTLGHSDMTMTKRYVNMTQSGLKDIHAVASPLNRLLDKGSRVKKISNDQKL